MSPATAPVPLRAARYTRVSRDEQNYGFSPKEQDRLTAEYGEQRGYVADPALTFHDDYTGKRLDRPALTDLIDAVRAGRVDVVVVLDLSRLTRDQDHHGYLRTLFKQHGARVEFVRHQVPDDPAGRLMLDFHAFQGAQEWENTRWRTQNGLRAKARSGKPLGSARPPFGLRYKAPVIDPAGLPVRGTVRAGYEPDPATVDALRWMFARYDAGASLRGVGTELDARGVRPPYADRPDHRRRPGYSPLWSVASVRGVLTNPAYVGEGWQYTSKVVAPGGASRSRTKRERWTGDGPDDDKALPMADGVFPQVIDPALFARVQRRLAGNRAETQRKDRDPQTGLLRRGFVRCPTCNVALGVRDKGSDTRYFHHAYSAKTQGCTMTTVLVDKLDGEVWAWLGRIMEDPDRFAGLVERLSKQADDGRSAAMLSAADARLAEIGREEANYVANLGLVSGGAAALVADKLRRLGDERERLRRERIGYAERARADEVRRERLQRAVARCRDARPDDPDALDWEQKRRLMRDLGVVVFLYPPGNEVRWGMTLLFDGDRGRVRAVCNSEAVAVWTEGKDDMVVDLEPPDMFSRSSATIGRIGTTVRRQGEARPRWR